MEDFILKPLKNGKHKLLISSQVKGILTRNFGYTHFNFVFNDKKSLQNEVKLIKKRIKKEYKGNLIIDLN